MTYTAVQIASMLKTSTTGFLYSILEFSMQQMLVMAKVVCVRHYEFLQLWELWNLFNESLPKATSNSLDKAYLATMKCVVVSNAFKKVAEEQTKFKQIKRQLKALGFDNEYAGQMADTLNNACRFSITLRKFRVT